MKYFSSPQFSRSCALVQRGFGIGRQTIIGHMMRRERPHPRLGLALILLEAQWQSSVGESQMCLGLRNRRKL
jgi:hypothetical protein